MDGKPYTICRLTGTFNQTAEEMNNLARIIGHVAEV